MTAASRRRGRTRSAPAISQRRRWKSSRLEASPLDDGRTRRRPNRRHAAGSARDERHHGRASWASVALRPAASGSRANDTTDSWIMASRYRLESKDPCWGAANARSVRLEVLNEFTAGPAVDQRLLGLCPAGRFDPRDFARRKMHNDGFDLSAPNGRFKYELYRGNSNAGVESGGDGLGPT